MPDSTEHHPFIIRKSEIPILWLDSSIPIKLERLRTLPRTEKAKLEKLRDIVRTLVEGCRLLCPEAGQDEEYGPKERLVRMAFSPLSLGIRMLSKQGIFNKQVFAALSGLLTSSNTIELGYAAFFWRDPSAELREIVSRRFNTFVHTQRPDLLIQRSTKAKAVINRDWDDVRAEARTNKRSFVDQFKREQRSYAQVVADCAKRRRAGTMNENDEALWLSLTLYERFWSSQGGSLEDFATVFCSLYFLNMPIYRIATYLNADMMTHETKLKPSDWMDVELLSAVLPIADFVIVDNSMKNRILRLQLEREWGVGVYSLKDVDILFQKLESLR